MERRACIIRVCVCAVACVRRDRSGVLGHEKNSAGLRKKRKKSSTTLTGTLKRFLFGAGWRSQSVADTDPCDERDPPLAGSPFDDDDRPLDGLFCAAAPAAPPPAAPAWSGAAT